MHVKICSKCLKSLPLSSFYKRKTGTRSGQYYEKCSLCMKKRGREYYHKNHERQLNLANIRRRKAYLLKRRYIIKAKDKPCADCGKKYPFYAMDFDHRDHSIKIKEISKMFTGNWSLDKIKAEIEKCDVICANCHRIRTYKSLNNKKYVS